MDRCDKSCKKPTSPDSGDRQRSTSEREIPSVEQELGSSFTPSSPATRDMLAYTLSEPLDFSQPRDCWGSSEGSPTFRVSAPYQISPLPPPPASTLRSNSPPNPFDWRYPQSSLHVSSSSNLSRTSCNFSRSPTPDDEVVDLTHSPEHTSPSHLLRQRHSSSPTLLHRDCVPPPSNPPERKTRLELSNDRFQSEDLKSNPQTSEAPVQLLPLCILPVSIHLAISSFITPSRILSRPSDTVLTSSSRAGNQKLDILPSREPDPRRMKIYIYLRGVRCRRDLMRGRQKRKRFPIVQSVVITGSPRPFQATENDVQ
ncbi:unnamed protein product [Cyprideis torosa]|uniref:Uncharacterized protein n=1 Tax=Cyprideis torosa TaxID=163714 RepID=A0A7R8W3V1_9CRUS|nr:unnamed protein product [Cyprideis torosa]CAG0879977.1 unnamed protein product [Cyprideis torosa]